MKQRLVGTVVLGSLAVIFIPLLLDGEGVQLPPMSASMPAPPAIDIRPLPEPERPAIATDTPRPESAAAAEESPIPESVTNEVAPTATVADQGAPAAGLGALARLDAQGTPEAWSVRLGIFGSRANADALMARLLEAEYKAYLRPVETGQGTLSGVFVGPVLTRAEAGNLRQELLREAFTEDALVVQFEVAALE